MKIDAVLARHPWPWRVVRKQKAMQIYTPPWWQVHDDKGGCVFDDGSCGGEVVYSCDAETRDAIIELVAAHVARSTTQATHSEECWRWHHGCAVAMVRKGEEEMAELLAASGDILLSFTAGTECRIPHHQVERLFKAVHGKDAKTPWEDDEEDK